MANKYEPSTPDGRPTDAGVTFRGDRRPTDVIERLEQWVKLKAGDTPSWAMPGKWADVLNVDLQDAIGELRETRLFMQRHIETKSKIGCKLNAGGMHNYMLLQDKGIMKGFCSYCGETKVITKVEAPALDEPAKVA